MRHYVAYHNAERMGYSVEESEPFTVATSKPVAHLEGCQVWVIAGKGKPRSYSLVSTFVVDDFNEYGKNGFDNYIEGSEGQTFLGGILLDGLEWIRDFVKSQSNFSLGLQPIQDRFIPLFQGLVTELQRPRENINPVKTVSASEYRKQVEQAAIACAKDWYQARGWGVTTVESQKCGWDLTCRKGNVEEHVEVKGLSLEVANIVLTPNEFTVAQLDSQFVVFIVTRALSENKKILRYSWREFQQHFDVFPSQYRAHVKQ